MMKKKLLLGINLLVLIGLFLGPSGFVHLRRCPGGQ